MAPEFVANKLADLLPEKSVDIYALGMLICEVLLSQILPLNHMGLMLSQVLARKPEFHDAEKVPVLPSSKPNPEHPIWDLVKDCWSIEPKNRPGLDKICGDLVKYASGWAPEEWKSPSMITPTQLGLTSDSDSSE